MTLLLLLACSEYAVTPCAEDTALPTFATVEECPGYAAMWLPLVGEPVVVSFCDDAACTPVPFEVDRWLLVTCPAAGELRILWTVSS